MRICSALRAVVCHLRAASAVSIAVFVAACGGTVIESSSAPGDGGTSDSSPEIGCPSIQQIEDGTALGGACSSEGFYCTNSACDSCSEACPAITCTDGSWVQAINTGICVADAGPPPSPDASVDSGTCSMLDPVGYDTTCAVDSDCAAVPVGDYCTSGNSCICPAASINVSGQASYDAMVQQTLQSLPGNGQPGCSCPYFGAPTCVGGMCVLCGGASGDVGCPDGG